MPFEVVDPAERTERGVIYRTLTEAMVASGPSLEVWELADDEAQSRTVMCWPDTEFQPRITLTPTTLADVTPITKGKPDRFASAMLEEYPVQTREQIHALVALAYATGDRDGYAQCAADTDRFLRNLGVVKG